MKQIFEAPVLCRFKLAIGGYGFCKVINIRTCNNHFSHLAQVYDYVTKDENVDRRFASVVLANNFLFAPVPIQLPTQMRGHGAWKHIDDLPDSEIVIPEYKYTPSPLLLNEREINEWYTYCCIDNKKKRRCEYEALCHLEHFHVYNAKELAVRTTMELIKRQGKKFLFSST